MAGDESDRRRRRGSGARQGRRELGRTARKRRIRPSSAPCETCKHKRKGVLTRCDRKTRQANACDFGFGRGGRRHPLGCGREVYDKADYRRGLVRQAADAEPADLDEPSQLTRRARNQPAMRRRDEDAVIGNEPCEGEPSFGCRGDELEDELRFAGTTVAADQEPTAGDQHRRCMNGGIGSKARAARIVPHAASSVTAPAGAR